MTIRCRLIGRARWLSRLARREGLWAGRALHSPSRPQPRAMGQRSRRHRAAPERPAVRQPPVYAPSADAARSNAVSSRTPRGISRSAGRRWRVPSAAAAQRASPRSYQYVGRAWTACEPWSYRADGIAGLHRLAERLRKNGCGRWRVACAGALQAARLSGTTVDTIAEFLLGCA